MGPSLARRLLQVLGGAHACPKFVWELQRNHARPCEGCCMDGFESGHVSVI